MKVNLDIKRKLVSVKEVIIFYVKALYNKFDEDHIWILSAGIAFELLLCLIPFNLILFSILGVYLQSDSAVGYIDSYLNNTLHLPPEIKENIRTTVFAKMGEISSNITLTVIIGIAGLLWTTSGLFSSIRSVLNKIYKIDLEIFFIWAKLRDMGMVLIITILFFISFLMTSIYSLVANIDEKYLFGILKLPFLANIAPIILGMLFSFLMFYLILRILPHGKISNNTILISSISSSILWEILKYAFTFYLLKLSNFAAVYGIYASIAVLILWLYYSSVTFVIGAEIGQIYNEKKLLEAM